MSSKDHIGQDYEIYTATAVHLRKIDSPVRQTSSAGTECPHMARDQRVTSTMPPPSSPYDHSTPPMTPRFYAGTTPRSSFYAQTLGYPRRPDAAAVWHHSSQLGQTTPRVYGPRDGVDYNRAQDAPLNALHPFPYSIPPYLQAYAAGRIPKMHAQHYQLPRIVIPTHPSEMVSTKPSQELHILDGSEHIPKKTKTKSVSKTPEWFIGLTQKKRRPSEIFNKNFGFDVASLRAPSDRTPQISPRTSISRAGPPSPISPADSVKRQRIDSKSADMALGFPFGKPTPAKSMRGRDLGSPAMSPRDSIVHATPATSRHGTMSSEDVHPGTPVDWSSPYPNPSPNTYYYPPTTPEPRRRSFPSISLPAERKRSKETAMLARLSVLDTTTKQFGTCPSSNTTPTGRKRACTLERRDRTSRKVVPKTTSTSASSSSTRSVQSRGGGGGGGGGVFGVVPCVPLLKRATSDPSTEAFLKHVRASLEKRRSSRDAKGKGKGKGGGEVDYLVFTDEDEKGFLDDAPL
ncbi:hypothetical protein T440DRAFT_67865 [Plenodomus tracheiphilus IPT5]|uniref:Uncharacterized protein n=1 Tax=Plenodomus tracheiphilus IPT5 TaxID=1408161 RepID=A0A6A7B9M5_9PLEO|nr:hypothetical protein T440DRAFT_67865 [Plenodomus tracheiphilus IPT5]